MSKGSKRRPGKGYEENYDKIFKKPKQKEPTQEVVKKKIKIN